MDINDEFSKSEKSHIVIYEFPSKIKKYNDVIYKLPPRIHDIFYLLFDILNFLISLPKILPIFLHKKFTSLSTIPHLIPLTTPPAFFHSQIFTSPFTTAQSAQFTFVNMIESPLIG